MRVDDNREKRLSNFMYMYMCSVWSTMQFFVYYNAAIHIGMYKVILLIILI